MLFLRLFSSSSIVLIYKLVTRSSDLSIHKSQTTTTWYVYSTYTNIKLTRHINKEKWVHAFHVNV